jgi:ribbon-helix-helix protein, copG family
MNDKEKVSLTLDRKVILHLRKMAKDSDRTLSQYINVLLRKYLSGEKIDISTKI